MITNDHKEYHGLQCVYKLRDITNNKNYVGGTKNLYNRLCTHKDNKLNSNTSIHKAIQERGWDNFEVDILEEVSNIKELRKTEHKYIEKFDSENPEKGYNGIAAIRTRKKVKCIETGVIYKSSYEVFRKLGFAYQHINECCRNLRKSSKGFTWEFV